MPFALEMICYASFLSSWSFIISVSILKRKKNIPGDLIFGRL